MIKNAIIHGRKILFPGVTDSGLVGANNVKIKKCNFNWINNICENCLMNPWNYINIA